MTGQTCHPLLYFFNKRSLGGTKMGPVVYALFTYALTAVISFAVIGVVVLIDKVMSRKGEQK